MGHPVPDGLGGRLKISGRILRVAAGTDQINRLELIKRQGYGRAGLDLLQRRMVLAA